LEKTNDFYLLLHLLAWFITDFVVSALQSQQQQ